MIIKKMFKFIFFFVFINSFIILNASANNDFDSWLKDFKIKAVNSGISKKLVDQVMSEAVFIPKVIEYDRYQPEFYEDTFTYIKKRSSNNKIKQGLKLYKKEKIIIEKIEKEFNVEKELLLALMGIETNFGKYLGKMDIISSLATLSFDKRRSDFFTKELLILLNLVDKKIIDREILYGSWAGAFGNFQFMPSTIEKYALDYDKNNIIELKTIDDSFASAANYINKMGWKKDQPCFYEVQLKKNIPNKFLNTSARKLKNKKKLKFFKKYILNSNEIESDENLVVAIITPDKDIIPDSNNLKPAFVVFSNYELILKWNRSLRFALATCKLKDDFFNEL